MSFLQSTAVRSRAFHIFLGVGTVAFGIAVFTLLIQNDAVLARLVRQKETTAWFVIQEEDVERGVSIPADTNVVFHLPFTFETIDRRVLLSNKGQTVRYWGYCFPQNYDPKLTSSRTGFPGLMFLSEKEREIRRMKAEAAEPVFSFNNLPTKAQVEKLSDKSSGTIRHQVETFKAGMLCYIMTEAPLGMGLDPDQDGLNSKLETDEGTDPSNPDSDGDGLPDGTEVLTGTNPTLRDTDADGIIDGIEDKNWNGRINAGETDPRTKDTDRDGLCDGMCRIRLSNGQQIYAGEDKNLNGLVDSNETDPLKINSKNDGYGDYPRFLKCILDGGSEC